MDLPSKEDMVGGRLLNPHILDTSIKPQTHHIIMAHSHRGVTLPLRRGFLVLLPHTLSPLIHTSPAMSHSNLGHLRRLLSPQGQAHPRSQNGLK